MKNFSKSIFAAFALIAAVACNKPAADKAAVEKGFQAPGDIPTAVIEGKVTSDGVSATVTFTVSGATESAQKDLEFGVVASTDPTFYSSAVATVEVAEGETLADGTYTLKVAVEGLSHVYVKAYAANAFGSNFSEVVEIDTPDSPDYMKVAGTYNLTTVSYFDETDIGESSFTIKATEDPFKFVVENFNPFWLENEFTADNDENIFDAVFDPETNTLEVAKGPIAAGSKYLSSGIDASTGELINIVIEFEKGIKSGVINTLWGATATDITGWYALYAESTVTKK